MINYKLTFKSQNIHGCLSINIVYIKILSISISSPTLFLTPAYLPNFDYIHNIYRSTQYIQINCMIHIYRYGHINVSTFHYPYQTHTSGGPIWINFFFPERYCKNLWDDGFGFFDFCVLWRLGPKTVFLGPLA